MMTKNLKLIGNGPNQYTNKIRRYIKEYGLGKNIKIIENQSSVEKFLINSEIGILTSDEEGFSNSILEYMSFGLCVVATKVGGNEEAIIDNDCGYLINKNDHVSLSKKLNTLIENKAIIRKMGKSSFKRVSKEFNMIKSASDISSVYKNYLN